MVGFRSIFVPESIVLKVKLIKTVLRRIVFICLLPLLLGLVACGEKEPPSPSVQALPSELMGMWIMGKVYQDTLDVTDEFNPGWNRWVTFTEEGSFESGGAPIGYSSGSWQFDSTSSELFLDSDAGEEDDSYWFVSETDTSMEWTGARSEITSQYRLTFIKKGLQ